MADAETPETGWLRLLVDDAPRAALDAHRLALAGTVPAAGRGPLERDAALAAVLHQRLAEQRRHARELRVLNDLARRLASLRDTADLLHEVAAQSRQLLGVDLAYIMLREGGSPTLRIEVVDGSMGSALRGVELHEGQGLGGEVLRTGRPRWSESYLEDTDLGHVGPVDGAAVSEQLGGILGVPLQVGEDTLGVLLAADRRPRRFGPSDVELLAGLAAHAAAALRNAQLFDEQRRAREELQEANATLRRAVASRAREAELREDLGRLVVRGAGLREVGERIARAVGRPVHVLGADGRPLDPVLPEAPPELAAAAAELAGDPDGDRPGSRPAGAGWVTLAPVVLRDGPAGCLGTAGPRPPDDEDAQLLRTGAVSVALVVTQQRLLAEAELRARGELVHALFTADVDEAALRRSATAARLDVGAVTAVLVLVPGDDDVRTPRSLAARVTAAVGGWTAEHEGEVVVLVAAAPAPEVRDRLRELPAGTLPAAVGVAPCAGGVAAVRSAHRAARQTARLLVALGRSTAVASAEEVGVYRGLFSHAGRGDVRAFVGATLGPLLRHDEQRGRDLTRTVQVYLAQAQHHARTCAVLHVHANTLYQRLDRVTELLGAGWRDPDRVLDLQLALRLNELLGALPPD
ncbi:Sugar diacid utilization regulator [Geodermatophilus telluris]|uniref:Sugar diacid utilization regulator n=1 Tax=Geodermatophilus telluris TaxID=1190417 RepID=A0A1G6QGA5_9ACTN|nr:helix-turn-helix domain-containing protein [Geodermatophilus telluris]SDC91191.1 Sugar diacid utilization regulator [Geodermatophilus telluris]